MKINPHFTAAFLAWSQLAFSQPIPLSQMLESTAGKFLFNKSLSRNVILTIGAADSKMLEQLNGNMEFANALTKPRFKFVRAELEERFRPMRDAFAQKFPKRAKTVFEGSARLSTEELLLLNELAVEYIDKSPVLKFYARERGDIKSFSSNREAFLGSNEPAGVIPNGIISTRQWNALTLTEHQTLLHSATKNNNGLEWREYKNLRSIKSKEQKAFAENLLKQARQAMPHTEDFTIAVDGNVAVGEPMLTIEIYTLADGEVIGGKAHFLQASANIGHRPPDLKRCKRPCSLGRRTRSFSTMVGSGNLPWIPPGGSFLMN